jgi:hypothetical protein
VQVVAEGHRRNVSACAQGKRFNAAWRWVPRNAMNTLRFAVLWWAALAGWWLILVGTNAGLEEIAAACAATFGTVLALGLRRQGLTRYRFEPAWIVKSLKFPWNVVRELAIVFWALGLHLARIRPVRSVYRAFPFPTGGADPTSRGRRALAATFDAVSPNTFPVDIDTERGVVLRHELDPHHSSNDMP